MQKTLYRSSRLLLGVAAAALLLAVGLPGAQGQGEIELQPQGEVVDWALPGSAFLAMSLVLTGGVVLLFCLKVPVGVYRGTPDEPNPVAGPVIVCVLFWYFVVAGGAVGAIVLAPSSPKLVAGPSELVSINADIANPLAATVDLSFDNIYIIDNVNPFSFDLRNLDIDVKYDGGIIGTIEEAGPLKFGAGIVTQMNVPFGLTVTQQAAFSMGSDYFTAGGFDIFIGGDFEVTVGNLNAAPLTLSFNETYRVEEGSDDVEPKGDGNVSSVGGSTSSPIIVSLMFLSLVLAGYGFIVYSNHQRAVNGEFVPKPKKAAGIAGGTLTGTLVSQASSMSRSRGYSSSGSKGSRGSNGSRGSSASKGSKGSHASKSSAGSDKKPVLAQTSGQGAFASLFQTPFQDAPEVEVLDEKAYVKAKVKEAKSAKSEGSRSRSKSHGSKGSRGRSRSKGSKGSRGRSRSRSKSRR